MILETLYKLTLFFQDFFTAFGLFTIGFFITFFFVKKQRIGKIDEEAIKFIALIGVVYLLIWTVANIVEFNSINEEDKALFLNRMFGKYWFGFWIQPLLWFVITQLLRVRIIRSNIIVRLLFSLLLIFSIERMIIIFTSFHRDYLPSSWSMYNELGFYPSNLLLALIMKIIIFFLFVGIFRLIRLKIVKRKN